MSSNSQSLVDPEFSTTCCLLPSYHFLNPPNFVHLLLPFLLWSVLPSYRCESNSFPALPILQAVVHMLLLPMALQILLGSDFLLPPFHGHLIAPLLDHENCLCFAYQCLCLSPSLAGSDMGEGCFTALSASHFLLSTGICILGAKEILVQPGD